MSRPIAIRINPALAFVLALGMFSNAARAQLPVARLAHLFPPGGCVGTQVEVSAGGVDLDEPSRLLFSNSGITGAPAGDKFQVTIHSNVPPGIYEARFAGRFGLSNPRPFVVGALPEAIIPGTNITEASAFDISANSTVNSRATANAVGWFKFSAKKGVRIFLECLSESIDSRMEATLILSDATGRELERNRTGGLIDFTPAADGEYRVRVADMLYRGGEDYVYRLTLSTGPRLDFVLPPAGIPGTKTNFAVYGRNLPGGRIVKGQTLDGKRLERLDVAIEVPSGVRATRLETTLPVMPAAAGMDGFAYRLTGPRGVSNPLFIGFATAPMVLTEAEPNDKPAEAQRIVPPCEVAGQFNPAGDVDRYLFDAKKGDVYWMEVFSQRHGLPTDPSLMIQRLTKNDKGIEQAEDVSDVQDNDTNIGDREFNTSSRDPVTRFEARENGTYRITLRDAFGTTRASPANVYRLAVRREAPDFRLVAMAVAPKYKPDAKDIAIGIPLLRRGESMSVRVMAFRRDGFNGDIELSIEDPPPGLVFAGDRIGAGRGTDYILLTATEDAPAFAGPVRLVGRAKIGGQEVAREARGGTMRFPVASTESERPRSRATAAFALAICDKERAPISVTAMTNLWETAEKSKLEIPLRVARTGDFNAAFKLKPLGPGVQESLKEFDVAAKATNAILKLDLAALKLSPGTYVFTAQGVTTGKYRNNPEGAAAAETAAKEAEKLASSAADAAKKATTESEKAAKDAKEADDALKSATEKLTAARAAAAESADDEKAKAAAETAQKNLDEAAASAKAAAEKKSAAESGKDEAARKSKEALAGKDEAARRGKELAEKAKPRDVSYQVTSAPFTLRVTPAPVAASKETKEPKESPQAKSK